MILATMTALKFNGKYLVIMDIYIMKINQLLKDF